MAKFLILLMHPKYMSSSGYCIYIHVCILWHAGEVTYYFAIVAVDSRAQDVSGPVSNIASVSMKDFTSVPTDSGLSGGEIAAIVIG